MVKNLPAKTEGAGYSSSVPGLGKSPGVGNGNPLQYSCLGNPMYKGVCRAIVHEVTKSWTRQSTHTHIPQSLTQRLSLPSASPWHCQPLVLHTLCTAPITSWSFMYSFLCGLEYYPLLSLPSPSPGFQGNHPRQNANKYEKQWDMWFFFYFYKPINQH